MGNKTEVMKQMKNLINSTAVSSMASARQIKTPNILKMKVYRP